MERLRRYRTYLSNGLLAHKLLQLLGGIGLVIEPYHFYREEGIAVPAAPRAGDGEFEFFEAGRADADGIAALDPRADGTARIVADFGKGRRCFALRRGDVIVACSWCDTAVISFEPCRRTLRPDEAYLYGMETLYAYRGHNLAPYLRSRCHDALRAEGRTRVYSYTDCFNGPAIRFKEKIGATILFTGLHLKLPGLPGRNFILRGAAQFAPPAA